MSDQLRDLVEPFGDVEPPLDLHTRIVERERELPGSGREAWRPPRVLMIAVAAAGIGLVLLALALAAHSRSSTPAPAKHPLPARHLTHFAGLPPVGAEPSRPTANGKIFLNISPASGGNWNIYANGLDVWQKWTRAGDPTVIPNGADPLHTTNVQQRLTPQGVQLLRSKILAIGQPVGLFKHNLELVRKAYAKPQSVDWYQVRVGDRLVYLQVLPPGYSPTGKAATPAQIRAIASINTLVANAATRLPASVWADRTIRPSIPSHYCLNWDRADPDPAKLPSPARELLAEALATQKPGTQGIITTDQTRALLNAFVKVGVKFQGNHAARIDVNLPTATLPYTVVGFLPGHPNGC
ncbi:MAG TPA: hypothetical protein VFV02_11880 [Acidimicrobiales bacterium]|nr:hypothetical protein [Acidimicrobiales bacterium]